MYSVNSIFYYIPTCFFAVYYITSKLLFFLQKGKKKAPSVRACMYAT